MEVGGREIACRARTASLKIRSLPAAERVAVLERLAFLIETNQDQILSINNMDVKNSKGRIPDALMKRLQLTDSKLSSAVAGIRQISCTKDPIGKLLSRTQIMKDLILEKISVPIGVLLIIFEARPEALLQIVALALWSGNGLLLKGGSEAVESNAYLHGLVSQAIEETIPKVGPGLIGLIQSREEIVSLLQLDDVIDLVIPRGSNQLVSFIQKNTKIPVLGHADGICHVYIDEEVEPFMALEVCLDSKIDYPAACNAVEKILFHQSSLKNGVFSAVCQGLESRGVKVYKGDHTLLSELPFEKAPGPSHEYSSLEVTIEIVESVEKAVDHINSLGSAHTDSIITTNELHAKQFLTGVDSSCVFHNTSTRWSDGYRFGLGAEVGISTSRIHARGPVGVEGLLTTKFVLHGNGHVVKGDAKKNQYTFKALTSTDKISTSQCMYAIGGFLSAIMATYLYSVLKSQFK